MSDLPRNPNNPHNTLQHDERWADGFHGKAAAILDSSISIQESEVMKAQHSVVLIARALGYSNGESKRLLEQLGIAERVKKGEGQDCTQG